MSQILCRGDACVAFCGSDLASEIRARQASPLRSLANGPPRRFEVEDFARHLVRFDFFTGESSPASRPMLASLRDAESLYAAHPWLVATGYMLRSLRDQDLGGLRPQASLGGCCSSICLKERMARDRQTGITGPGSTDRDQQTGINKIARPRIQVLPDR